MVAALDSEMDPVPGCGVEALISSLDFGWECRLLRLALEAGALCRSEDRTG